MKKITCFHGQLNHKGLMCKTRLLLILLFVSSLSFAQVPTDAVAKYTFNGGSLINVADAGNGDLSGAAPTLRPDRFGGVDNAIRANAVTRNGYTLTGYNDEISISFWIAGSAPTGTAQEIFDIRESNGSGDGISMTTTTSNTLVANFINGNTSHQSSQSNFSSVFEGGWHHIVFTTKRDATGIAFDNSIYIDGTLHTTLSNGVDSNINQPFLNNNATFRISPNDYYGNIDDIEIFNRALTATEVQDIYTHIPEADIFYVDTSATGNNDGTSWADAFTDLHSALAITDLSDQVWVAKGTYKPHASDRNESFVVNTNLYGGFAGTEATLSERDMSLIHTANETILSGDLLGDDSAAVDFNDPTRDDNSTHVVEITTNNLTVDGVTIKDGNADATSGDDRFGGGLFKAVTVANFTIKNSVIKNNVAFSGAGLSLTTTTSESNMIVDACVIENNLANAASGIDYHRSGSVGTMNITVTNTLFRSNITDNDAVKNRNGVGAAALRLRAYFTSVTLNADVVNNTFVNNISAGSGGGDYPVVEISRNNGEWGTITVANNIFWANTDNTATLAKAIGRTATNSTRFGNTSASRIVKNNTDEDGLSLITGTTATSSTDPNLDADFKLTAGSTSIDTGDNSLIPAGITTDLLFNNRIFNTTVDRGAYEFDPSLGINDVGLHENGIKLYPNPTTSILNIEMIQSLKQVSIYSVLGTEVLRTQKETIDVSGLSNGIFLIKIEDENGNVSTKRFVKK
ncbi:T9SS type A sorting domain-containing protein [Winogradskyella psychrotolerans]|uniref:LamG-like jellyroll fold domain-containing protein n=1 Tax=Winogradskyella psychrotolerans TaxID=1344585 RepID=UPI001C0658F3|nr:LamG-like jellyroll fold domain-containing protein [Winogradskyella psychrotolerans]MBU2922930.1 T9SS type A sorting domain-containing protein [Winogradskyella psychrotolerans]